MNVKIKHIYHSGFILETDDMQMVFDYYKGDLELKDKKTIVFVSHGHGDHYTKAIFDWQKKNDDIHYVLSSDIADAPDLDNIYRIDPYESLDLEGLSIRSFGSTDLGLSLLIDYKDKRIFFSGDLNWWHWENDSAETQKSEEKQFKDEIAKINKITNRVDIALTPVDPRLGVGFSFGGEYLIEKLSPKYLIPMHFGDKWDTSRRFMDKMGDIETKIVDINKEGQVVEVEV